MKKKELNLSKNFYTIISILILAIIILGIGISYLLINKKKMEKVINNPNIYDKIYIADIDVSNLSPEEASSLLNEKASLDDKIILKINDKTFEYNKSDLVFYDFQKSIDEAYSIGREGNEKDRFEEINLLKENPKNIPLYHKLNEEKLHLLIEELEKALNKQPINSTIIKKNNEFEITEGQPGLALETEKLKEDIKQGLNEEGDVYLQLELREIKPKNKEDLMMIKHKLGGFTTKYTKGANDEGRITNMKIASEKINGTTLYPGEIFSTNEKFGPTTKENGYKPAKTIIDGKFEDDYGGGVCQVSSTLYNAILYSELEIVERRNHSLKVGYLDYGYDATLAGTYIDLKFKNSTNYPIYIESYLTDNEVICNIYGYDERPENREIKFQNALVEKIEPGPRIEKETDELPKGEEKVEVKPLTGYKYKLYKLIYLDGELVEKVLVNNSYYRPRAEEVLVGTNSAVITPVNNSKDKPISDQTETVKEINNDTTDRITDIATEISIENITESIIESTTEETTNNVVEPVIESVTESIIEEITEEYSTERVESVEEIIEAESL